jgi:adenosylcobinamide-phosphate synthase
VPVSERRADLVSGRALGLVAGYVADAVLGDPSRHHPVAGFGLLASRLEQRCHADSRYAGAGFTAVLVGTTAAVGLVLDRTTRLRPLLNATVTAAATWTVLGGRSLAREAGLVHDHLSRGDLDAAREQVTHLVGRDPSLLDADGIARATVESVAENTSDAVVAPLFWGAVAGPAGLLGYRAANTLDAMVGHRSARYARFGWASARLDDLLNLPPSRFTASAVVATAPALGHPTRGGPSAALGAWRRDARRHPSPNAGPVEAAFAGALGIMLGGVNTYGELVEDRGTLGTGTRASVADIPRATRLARLVGAIALVLTATTATALPRRRR